MGTAISVIGTIATEPKLVNPNSGTQLCSFRIASDERWYDREKQSWEEGPTNWFGVVCFRGLANHAYKSFNKGERVIVHGKLRIRKWEKDDRNGTSVEIEADAIGHDVRWGVSQFRKTVSGQNSASGQDSSRDASSSGTFSLPGGPSFPTPQEYPRNAGFGGGVDREEPAEGTDQSLGDESADSPEMSADGFTPATAAA